MRASDVRTAIISRIEGASVDAKASSGDVFRHVDVGAREVRGGKDRLFHVALSTIPARSRMLITTDLYTAEWMVSIFYADMPGNMYDRIAEDAERIMRQLDGLSGAYTDIAKTDLLPGNVTELEGLVTANITAIINYRLDSGV